jgi:hypothetical protein
LRCDSRSDLGSVCCSHCDKLDIPCVFLVENAVDDIMRKAIERRMCDKCGIIKASASHIDSCTGRCVACQQNNKPCKKTFVGGLMTACKPCLQAGIICSRSLDECSKCGRMVGRSQNPWPHHKQSCVGRCHECKENNLICEIKVSHRRCLNCTSLQKDCVFSLPVDTDDGDLRQAIARRLCGRCDVLFPSPGKKKEHAETCRGKCAECSRLGIPCFWDNASRRACGPCKRDGRECSG